MVQISITYEGDLHCSLVHIPSGATVETDAPIDNHGRGESFSPTDMVAGALGACMSTLMGIKARDNNIDVTGTTINVYKEMTSVPVRKIGRLIVDILFPHSYSDTELTILKNAALTCLVMKSINPDIIVETTFRHS
ncbi:MAG: OsmC family protein [Ignavibacteria bacterium]|nr:OsmC family protein [Ignavibacteria bacterium]